MHDQWFIPTAGWGCIQLTNNFTITLLDAGRRRACAQPVFGARLVGSVGATTSQRG